MNYWNFSRRRVLTLVPVLTVALSACAGGGTSAPTPQPIVTGLGGIGPAVALDQRINFTVIVPPPVRTGAATTRRRRVQAAIGNPYVSPNTASVALQIATVDGQSPQTLPAPVVVNIACGSSGGCSVPIQNVPAARGVDRFAVQTFSAAGATGNTISNGFVDVTVPSTQATSFGGTTLTIGGYVQSLALALNVAGGHFVWHAPASGTVDVNAVDPAGAIIIGNDQLANAITVSLPTSNGGAFTLNTLQTLALQQPAQTLTLAYNGNVLLAGSVTASTVNENSAPVSASLAIPVDAPPTPKPSPVPPTKPPLSLYVYDGKGDRILEYAGVNAVEGGQALSASPRRAFEIAQDPATHNITCSGLLGPGPILQSLAVSSAGTIYAQTVCTDTASPSTLAYGFTYAASTQEAVPAHGTPTPPRPTTTFSLPVQSAVPLGAFLDQTNNAALFSYSQQFSLALQVVGVSLTNTSSISTNFGATCLQEFGAADGCTTDQYAAFNTANVSSLAADTTGHIYIPSSYQATDSAGNAFVPPGNPAQQFSGEPAILAFTEGTNNAAPTPLGALAGFPAELGGSNSSGLSPAVATEGSTLYSLDVTSGLTPPQAAATVQVYPGLSGCPTPSGTAAVDTTVNQCVDRVPHTYLAGFANAASALTAAGAAGLNIASPPTFLLGGDVVGGFGEGTPAGTWLTVHDGFAFVLNPQPNSTNSQAEIDVYNTNGLTGYHTDIPLVARLKLPSSIAPISIAIGATGTGVGGADLLRRPARVNHDMAAWRRRVQAWHARRSNVRL